MDRFLHKTTVKSILMTEHYGDCHVHGVSKKTPRCIPPFFSNNSVKEGLTNFIFNSASSIAPSLVISFAVVKYLGGVN